MLMSSARLGTPQGERLTVDVIRLGEKQLGAGPRASPQKTQESTTVQQQKSTPTPTPTPTKMPKQLDEQSNIVTEKKSSSSVDSATSDSLTANESEGEDGGSGSRGSLTGVPGVTEEYLLTAQPAVVSKINLPYPAEAKEKNIEGVVVLELIIDDRGIVRKIDLISGPGFGLNEAAMAAVAKFKFRPAEINGKPTAAQIRYNFNFKLE